LDYCLDTSVYIEAHRLYYAFDIAPPFWKALSRLAKDGIIISPEAVYRELVGGKDELKQWAKENHQTMFIEPDSKVSDAYRQIADFANNRYQAQHWISEFLKGADPWVIAQAKAYDLTVVTMEGEKKTEEVDKSTRRFVGEIKIPNMCNHFGIKFISTFELVRRLKIGLG
jgi:Domain of unknown function (DUF4411)